MKECLVCGSPIVGDDSRKKYCGAECNKISSKASQFLTEAKKGEKFRRVDLDSPASLAGSYMYAMAKVKMIEQIMEYNGWNVPKAERIIEDYSFPDLDELETGS